MSFVYEVQQPMQMNHRWEGETLKWRGERSILCSFLGLYLDFSEHFLCANKSLPDVCSNIVQV